MKFVLKCAENGVVFPKPLNVNAWKSNLEPEYIIKDHNPPYINTHTVECVFNSKNGNLEQYNFSCICLATLIYNLYWWRFNLCDAWDAWYGRRKCIGASPNSAWDAIGIRQNIEQLIYLLRLRAASRGNDAYETFGHAGRCREQNTDERWCHFEIPGTAAWRAAASSATAPAQSPSRAEPPVRRRLHGTANTPAPPIHTTLAPPRHGPSATRWRRRTRRR